MLAGICAGAGWSQHQTLAASPLRFWLLHTEPWWSYFRHSDLTGTWLSGHQSAGEFLREQSQPGDRLVVTEASVMPFYAGLVTLDLFGLTDREVARAWKRARLGELRASGGIYAALAEIVFAFDPRWIVLDGHEAANGFLARTLPGRALVKSPRFQAYEPVFRATVYSAADAGGRRDRINVVFRRSRP